MKPRKDKILHLIAGFIIGLTALMILDIPLIGFASAMLIGLLKEVVWDGMMRKGTQEWGDWLYTIAGGLLAELLFYFL
jgi:hypothetical protein